MAVNEKIDVFISRKSADAPIAKELYNLLVAHGLSVFESDETLPRMGNSDYRKAIDLALDSCTHMIVAGSSVANIQSSWVEAEWGFFIAEKRAGRKPGNILTVITGDLTIEELPPSLRNYEVIAFDSANFSRLLSYLGEAYAEPPGRWPLFKKKWISAVALLFLALASVFYYVRGLPVDVTFFVKPPAEAIRNTGYPPFSGGTLSVILGNKEEKKQLLDNGEMTLRQTPASFIGQRVPVRISADYWKASVDSINLDAVTNISLVPDGSLASVSGKVTNTSLQPLSGIELHIGSDTTIVTDASGAFKATLPYSMQKTQHQILINATGYRPSKTEYYPVSGSVDIVLTTE
jgi:hypothetical protein